MVYQVGGAKKFKKLVTNQGFGDDVTAEQIAIALGQLKLGHIASAVPTQMTTKYHD